MADLSIEIAAGAASGSKSFTLTPTDDTLAEGDETISVTGASAGVTVTGDEITITDDDPDIVLSKTKVTVAENGGTASYTVRLATQPSAAVTVAVTSGDTSAATVNPEAASLSFTTGNWNMAQTVTVTGVDDAIDNTPDRSLNIAHAASGGDYASVSKNLPVTVTDDEGAATLSVADASVAEGDTGTASLTFTVTLAPAADHAVTVAWATSKETSDTATPGTDYTAASGTLSFAAGDTSKSATVSVTGDVVDEPDETLTLTLSSASGAALGTDAATGTITDDDSEPGGITLKAAPDSVAEDGSAATVTVTATVTGGTRFGRGQDGDGGGGQQRRQRHRGHRLRDRGRPEH